MTTTKLAPAIQPPPIPRRERTQRYTKPGNYFTNDGIVSVGVTELTLVETSAPLSQAERLRFKEWLNDWSIGRDAADQICASRIFDQLGA